MKTLSVFLAAVMLSGVVHAQDLKDWQHAKTQSLSSLKAPVRIVNLWATWCKPCRKEMPEMSAWYKKQKKGSVDMVGIALDNPENIGAFLKQTPVSYPIWRYDGKDSRGFMKSLGNTVGGLPFTTVEAVKCGHKETVFGEIDGKKLDAAVKKVTAACKK
ncbi:TlpA disulfide reductase family protein [Neisseria weaveri]|uniref:TlpA disulfide reductase family protein n=1 Tax=Neisseria weaveri TaxID=28091 RepID=UPI0007C9AB18|nr:TlpA disulfide reductase family protein [Neisseria weaveri]SAY51858.1 thioredoxin [Neisseria weaveri]